MKLFLSAFLFLPIFLSAQGMIVNEVSNGPAGAQEFMEFVVIGSSASPTGGVDLSGWIIDDNNGDFEALATGQGIASGHFRIAAGCLTDVAPGSIILIYNDADPNPAIPAASSDPGDADSDCVYIFMSNDPCIEECTSTPVVPTSSNGDYTACGGYGQNLNWNSIGLSNNQDAAQVRMPDGSFFHGYCYGLNAPFPTFPAVLGGGSSFRVPGSGTNGTFFFNCGNFTELANFSKASASTNDSPGTPNNDANRFFINALRDGTYDYSNLNAAGNCGTSTTLAPCPTLLNLDFRFFNAEKSDETAILDWRFEQEENFDYIEIQRSSNALSFETIGILEQAGQVQNYQFIDDQPSATNYYRLRIFMTDGSFSYSKVLHLNFNQSNNSFSIVPNPVRNTAEIRFAAPFAQRATLQVYDMLGKLMLSEQVPSGSNIHQLNCEQLAPGTYIISIQSGNYAITRKFIK